MYKPTTKDLKKELGIDTTFTLCAECPHASWEGAETNPDDNSSFTADRIERFAPLVTDKVEKYEPRNQQTITKKIHAACYCTAKGHYASLPIKVCQAYEQAQAEAEA